MALLVGVLHATNTTTIKRLSLSVSFHILHTFSRPSLQRLLCPLFLVVCSTLTIVSSGVDLAPLTMSGFVLPLPFITSIPSNKPPLPLMPSTTLAPSLPLPPPPTATTIQPLLKSLHSKPPTRRPSTLPPQPQPPPPTLEQREEVELQKVKGRIDEVRRWREGLQRGEIGGEVPLTGEMVRRREEQKRLQQRRRTEQAQATKQQQQRDKEERKEQEVPPTDSRPIRVHRQSHAPAHQRLRPAPAAIDRVRVALDEDDGSRRTQQGRDDVIALLESLQNSSPRPPSPLFAPPLHPSPHSIFTPSPIHPRAVTPTRHSGHHHRSTAEVTDEQRRKAAEDRRQYLAFLNEQVDAMNAEGVTAATPRHRGRPSSARGRGRGGRAAAAYRQHPQSIDRPHTAYSQQRPGDEQTWQQHDEGITQSGGRGRIDWSDLERQAQQLQDEWIDLQADTALRSSLLTLSSAAIPGLSAEPLPPLHVQVREETEDDRLRRQLLTRLQHAKMEVEVEHSADTAHTTTTTTRSHARTTTSKKPPSATSLKSKSSATHQQKKSSNKENSAVGRSSELQRRQQVAAAPPSYPFLQHLQQLFSVQPTFIPPAPPAPVSTAQYLPMAAPIAPAVPVAALPVQAVFAAPPPPPSAPVVIVTPPHTVITPNLPPPAMSFTPPPPLPPPPPALAPAVASVSPAPSTIIPSQPLSVEQASVAVQAEDTNTRRDAATDTMPSLFASAAERAAAPPASPHLPTSLSSSRGAQTEVQPARPVPTQPPAQRDPATLSSSAAMQQATATPAPTAAAAAPPPSADSLLDAQLRARNMQNEALLSTLEAFLARKKQHDAQQALRNRLTVQHDTADDGGLLSLLLRAFELADEKKVDEQWAAALRREEEEAKRREEEEARRRQTMEAEQRRRREEEEAEKRRLEAERRRLEEEERRQRERAEEQQRLLVEMERRMEEKLQREKQEQEQRLKHEQEVQAKHQQALLDQQRLKQQHDDALRRQREEEERRVVEQRQMAEQERQQRLVDDAKRKEEDRLEYERRQAEAKHQEEERLRRWQEEEAARAQKRREEQEEIERVRVRLLDEREEWERQRREEAREKEFRMLGALKAEVESLKQQKVQMDAANDMAKRRVDAAERRATRNSKARAGASSESDSSDQEEEEAEEEEEEVEEEREQSDSSHTDDTASTVRSEGEFGAVRFAQPRVSTGYRSPGTFSPAISLPPSPGHVTAAAFASHASLPFTVTRPDYGGLVHAPPSPGSILVNERGLMSGDEQRRRVAQQLSTIKRRGKRPPLSHRHKDGSDISEGGIADDVSEELSEGEISRTGQHVLVGGAFVALAAQSSARPPRAIVRPPKHKRRQPVDSEEVESEREMTTAMSAQPPLLIATALPVLPQTAPSAVMPAFTPPAARADVRAAVIAPPLSVPVRAAPSKLSSHSASASASGWEEEIDRAQRRLATMPQRAGETQQAAQPSTSSQPSRQHTPPPPPAVQPPTAPVQSSAPPSEPSTPPVPAALASDKSVPVSRRSSVASMVSQWETAGKRSGTASTSTTPARSVVHSRTTSSQAADTQPVPAPIVAIAPPSATAQPVKSADASSAYTSVDEKEVDTAVHSETETPFVQQRKQQEGEVAELTPQPPHSAGKDSEESIEIEEEYSADDF